MHAMQEGQHPNLAFLLSGPALLIDRQFAPYVHRGASTMCDSHRIEMDLALNAPALQYLVRTSGRSALRAEMSCLLPSAVLQGSQ